MIEVPANGTLPVPAADPGKQRGAKHGGDDHGGRRASQEAYKRGAAFALIVQRQESGLRASFEKPLTGFFGELGKAASDVSAALLEAEPGKARRRGAKADELLIETILDRLGLPAWASRLRKLYEAHYLSVAQALAEAFERGGRASCETPLAGLFGGLGKGASDVSAALLEAEPGKARRRGAKADELLIETSLDRLGIPAWASRLRKLYEAHYLSVAQALAEAFETGGLGASVPDQVAQSIEIGRAHV